MRRIFLFALAAAFAWAALGQEFEVVSVKPNRSGSSHSGTHSDRGLLRADNLSLKNMIGMAYDMKEYQVEGPDWLSEVRFDVAAKFPNELPNDREKYRAALGAMMQKMLVERFRLAVHRDQKSVPAYGLIAGKRGVKFKEVASTDSHSNSNNTHFTGTVTMDQFAGFLSRRMDLPVVDMTGLKGVYDLTLDWVQESRRSAENKDGAAVASDAPAGPTLADALQDQLGLKLERRKAPITILIVDHAERSPSEN